MRPKVIISCAGIGFIYNLPFGWVVDDIVKSWVRYAYLGVFQIVLG